MYTASCYQSCYAYTLQYKKNAQLKLTLTLSFSGFLKRKVVFVRTRVVGFRRVAVGFEMMENKLPRFNR